MTGQPRSDGREPTRVLVLSRDDLAALLPPADLVDALAEAFVAYARGATTTPPRSVTAVGDDALLLLMPAIARGEAGIAAGTKLVTYYGGNPARGHPTIYATYVLMDGATGAPLAVLEGTFITGVRTGATSALAARYLARADARRVACVGAGVQAAFQLRCLAAVRAITGVDVLGRDAGRARAFADRMSQELRIDVRVADDRARAIREADIVTCATTSASPVFDGGDLRPGTHVDAVGAFRPDTRELDAETVRRARVVVDTYAGALEEAGDVLIAIADGVIDRGHVAAELAELVTGARPGRRADDEITVFKSVGFALEDLTAARLAYNRAVTRGIGTSVSL